MTAVVPPYGAGEAGRDGIPTFFTADSTTEVAPGSIGRWMLDFVTIHEFGHGYFYGIPPATRLEEPMLDEGMNEYWDQRMMTERNQTSRWNAPGRGWFGATAQITRS